MDYGSKSGGSDDDEVEPPPLMAAQPEDPKMIREAGNDLFDNGNTEGAIKKHKEEIAAGSKGGVQMTTKNSKQIPPPPSKGNDDMEVFEEEAEQHTSTKGQPYLPPRSKDDEFPAIRRKEPRKKKAVDKWYMLWFMPMPVLNRQDGGAGSKEGRRGDFNTYNRLGCKGCKHAFHKTNGYKNHKCIKRTSLFSSRPSHAPRSSSSSARYTTQENNDKIDIVGNTELDRKKDEKADKNDSKMTLKGQRETGTEPKGVKPPREQTAEKLEAKHKREREAAPDIKEGVEEAKPKNRKPPRERTTEELDAKLVHEKNVDK